jgi:hypothetical protein
MQRTLKRELKVRETVEREADETTAGLYLSVSLGMALCAFYVHLVKSPERGQQFVKVVCVVSRAAVADRSVHSFAVVHGVNAVALSCLFGLARSGGDSAILSLSVDYFAELLCRLLSV